MKDSQLIFTIYFVGIFEMYPRYHLLCSISLVLGEGWERLLLVGRWGSGSSLFDCALLLARQVITGC